MGKTYRGKEKAKAKVAKAKAKIARKTKRGALAAIAFALLCVLLIGGCATSDSAQPAKSQTQNNTFDDCVIIVAARATVSNGVIKATGGEMPSLELFTQTQSLESTGSTETISPSAVQTPTTDVKPDIDLNYNDAVGAASSASKSVLDTLAPAAKSAILALMSSKSSGTVTVEKADGTSGTVKCDGGQCSFVE